MATQAAPDRLRDERKLTPCVHCTFPELLDAAVREQEWPRYLILCPKSCWSAGEDHARCPRCRALRAAAAAHGLTCTDVTWPARYPLVVAAVRPDLRHSLETRYVLIPVLQDAGQLSAEALRFAWARRVEHTPIVGVLNPQTLRYDAIISLDLTLAAKVTAPTR